jgi:hypothetical protein
LDLQIVTLRRKQAALLRLGKRAPHWYRRICWTQATGFQDLAFF